VKLIYETSRPGRRASRIPKYEALPELDIPQELRRVSSPRLPEVAEPDIVRHFTALSTRNYGIDTGFYPLGSCTMKLNATTDTRDAGACDLVILATKAMHVAAANPMAISRGELPADALDRERDVLVEQARGSGKPEAVIQKMVEGRLGKFYEEVCLLEQAFVMDPQTKVSALLEVAGKELGAPVRIGSFVRFALGEGLEKAQEEASAA